MHGFGLLAEAKIRQWERDVREGRAKKPTGDHSAASGTSESLEKVLFHEIRRTIIKAYMATGETRREMLASSNDMQVQLASRLEKSGYNLMSNMLADEIQAMRAKVRAAGDDAALLASMLRELE